MGVKPLRSAGLVALALKGLWVAGSDPGQPRPLTLTGGTHLSPWKQANQPISEPESESAGIQRKSSLFYSSRTSQTVAVFAFLLSFSLFNLLV